MAEFDAEKLNQRLEQLNREQLATMQKLVEQLLRDTREGKPLPNRADEARVSPGSR